MLSQNEVDRRLSKANVKSVDARGSVKGMHAKNSGLRSRVPELESVVNQLNGWTSEQGRESLAILISRLERFSRMERSDPFKEFLSNSEFSIKLLGFAKDGCDDVGVVINVISALGNMIDRYGLLPSDSIFDFFVDLMNEKRVAYHISIFITKFPQFKRLPSRWDYVVSIPRIAPRSDSAKNFCAEIKRAIKCGEVIPPEYRDKVVAILDDFSSKTKSKVMEEEYKTTISYLLGS
ncbi:hypothetical protein [Burkholderia sp. Ac-20349]|uniref:hypothetical protein n=1 Tax=Burkholderia sp. Ac-20349 TaxID=2703893 RepID=UPI00197B852C|nr:hypothetical protein [Burkholderia sp. Ac-20349]